MKQLISRKTRKAKLISCCLLLSMRTWGYSRSVLNRVGSLTKSGVFCPFCLQASGILPCIRTYHLASQPLCPVPCNQSSPCHRSRLPSWSSCHLNLQLTVPPTHWVSSSWEEITLLLSLTGVGDKAALMRADRRDPVGSQIRKDSLRWSASVLSLQLIHLSPSS